MIHQTAIISPSAKLGPNVSVGPFTIIHGNVDIGADTVIGSHCEIGHPAHTQGLGPLVIGEGSMIRSHCVLYEGSTFGPKLMTGHRCVIRDGTRAGENLILGVGGDIQGDCEIGDYVRMQSDVATGKGSKIGNFVWLFPRVSLLNDPLPPSDLRLGVTVGDFAVVCPHSVLLAGVKIGEGAFIGAGTLVSHDVVAHRIACGSPMTDKGSTSRLRLRGTRQAARPWPSHFQRGYPPEIVAEWAAQVIKLVA